jgi:hypothetical protein
MKRTNKLRKNGQLKKKGGTKKGGTKKKLYKSVQQYRSENPTAPGQSKPTFFQSLFRKKPDKFISIINANPPEPGVTSKSVAKKIYPTLPHPAIRKSLKMKREQLNQQKHPLNFLNPFLSKRLTDEENNLSAAQIISYLPADVNSHILPFIKNEQKFTIYFNEDKLNQIYELCKLYLLEFENQANRPSIDSIITQFITMFENIHDISLYNTLAIYINNRLKIDKAFIQEHNIRNPSDYYNHDIMNFLRFFKYLHSSKNPEGVPIDKNIPIPIVNEYHWDGEWIQDEEDENEVVSRPLRLLLKKTIPFNRILNLFILKDYRMYEEQIKNGPDLFTFWRIHWYSNSFKHGYWDMLKLLTITETFSGTDPEYEATDINILENQMSVVLDMDSIPVIQTQNELVDGEFLLDSSIPLDVARYKRELIDTIIFSSRDNWPRAMESVPAEFTETRHALQMAIDSNPEFFALLNQ